MHPWLRSFQVQAITASLCWWWWCTITTATSSHPSDRDALLSIKAAIQLDPLRSLASWSESLHYCQWQGVSCGRRHPDRVLYLHLGSQGLVGPLSPHVGNLSFLHYLTLTNNSFHGEIPQELGRLSRLEYLELSNNSFVGAIPTNLSRCSNLYYVNLIDNGLTGNIPSELALLSGLEDLGLAKNNLSGTIPRFLGNLTLLSKLTLSKNNFHGVIPEEIGNLKNLGFLRACENNLTGEIPSSLCNNSALFLLALCFNELEGVIPSYIGSTLYNLQVFILAGNKLSGIIPSSLSNASRLEAINLSDNQFSGPIPRSLGSLSRLQILQLESNSLKDDVGFISALSNCTNLTDISLASNLIEGSLPESISNLSSSIQYLVLSANQIHGNIPLDIKRLVNLERLHLGYNHLTGAIPATIGKLRRLYRLYLNNNYFTGEIPDSFSNLTVLSELYMASNYLEGSIPVSLGNCSSLTLLNISYNILNGSIPPEILTRPITIAAFDLSHNALIGPLPSEVESLTSLGQLDVSYNKLSGLIPNSLGKCLSLEVLYLEGNSFQGKIPDELSALEGLKDLDLSDNLLSGQIPSSLCRLQLLRLNLSHNQLHGMVPTDGVFKNSSEISLEGNSGLCGGIQSLHFPPCPPSMTKKSKHKPSAKVIIISLTSSAALCSILLATIFVLYRRPKSHGAKGFSLPSFKDKLLRLSYAELYRATNGFSQSNLIGSGGYSLVFKGILDQDQTIVAVKVFNLQRSGGSKSFMSECLALRSIRHRNLVKILSACSSMDFQGNDFKALVYEFMVNGSLDKWVHPTEDTRDSEQESPRIRTLIQRLNIAIDVSSALVYLHHGCESTIVHGDLKPSNVLLDEEMTAHVGDFGLAKVISSLSVGAAKNSTSSNPIKGTIGYVAPEYAMGGMVSTEGDAYSFGILLLEMFTGKKPTDITFDGGLSLHKLAEHHAFPERAMEIVHPSLASDDDSGDVIQHSMASILGLGVACSMEFPRDRMAMGAVVGELQKIRDVYQKHHNRRNRRNY